jgi:hypothetical protein
MAQEAHQPRIETDPFGHQIIVESLDLSASSVAFPEPHTAISDAIRKPALLIEINGSSQPKLYFFRSVNWNHTLLIGAHLKGDEWKTFTYVQDPSNAELSELLKKGKQLI